MESRSVRWSIGVSLCVFLVVPAAGDSVSAQTRTRGSLTVMGSPARTAVEITSTKQLNDYLIRNLVVTYSDDIRRALDYVIASVVIGPDGRRLGECVSGKRSIRPGDTVRLPAACESGGFVTATGGAAIGNARIGSSFVINHEEQYVTGDRLIDLLSQAGAEQARRQGAIVIAVGAAPVDRDRAAGIMSRAAGYPCVKY